MSGCRADVGTGSSALAPSPLPAFTCFISFLSSDLVLPGSGFIMSTCKDGGVGCSGPEKTASFHFSFSAAAEKMLQWQLRCKTNPNPFCFPSGFGVGNPSSGAGWLAATVFLLSSGDEDASWLRFTVLTSKTPAGPRHPVGFAWFPSASEARPRGGSHAVLPSRSLAAGMDGADGCLVPRAPRGCSPAASSDPPQQVLAAPRGTGNCRGGENRMKNKTCRKTGCRKRAFPERGWLPGPQLGHETSRRA